MNKITKSTTIEEILEQYPETVKVFMDFGVPCLVCGEPLWGKVEEVAEKYGADLTELLNALNDTLGA
jgi:hybrid cluster-associated redox disulfide protein